MMEEIMRKIENYIEAFETLSFQQGELVETLARNNDEDDNGYGVYIENAIVEKMKERRALRKKFMSFCKKAIESTEQTK